MAKNEESMLPEFLTEEYNGYPLWQILLFLLVVVVIAQQLGFIGGDASETVSVRKNNSFY